MAIFIAVTSLWSQPRRRSPGGTANAKNYPTIRCLLIDQQIPVELPLCSAASDWMAPLNRGKEQGMPRDTKTSQATKEHRGQSGKSIEQRVQFATAHRTRVYILTLLNEGVYSPDEIAAVIEEPVSNVHHHIKELLDARSIELAKTERIRNTQRHYYRAVEMPFYSDEELLAMTYEERQATIGLTLQCLMAEMLSSFWSGRMESDPSLWLAWRWFNVDKQGRQELAEEQARWWERAKEIEAGSINRRAQFGSEVESIDVAIMGFPRARTAPKPSADSNFSKR